MSIKITHLKRALRYYKGRFENLPSFCSQEELEDIAALIEAADQTLQRMLKKRKKPYAAVTEIKNGVSRNRRLK